jgi:hypothetical protein
MPTVNLGRIKPVLKGTWISGTEYKVLDIVTTNGTSYIRSIAGSGTINPASDTTNWNLMVSKGADGSGTSVNNAAVTNIVGLIKGNGSTISPAVANVDYLAGDYEPAAPTIRPSLLLDFANSKSLDPRITFTRASTATRVNEKGLIEVVASGAPRFDHDTVTGECKGLLIEEQRVNLLTYSEQFDNAAWVKNNVTVTANAITAPDGSLTADKLVEGTASNTTSTLTNTQVLTNVIHTVSCFAKAGEQSQICLSWWDGAVNRGRYFDLSAGTVGGELGSATTATITPVGNGWYRCMVTGVTASNAGSAAGYSIRTAVNGSINYTGNGASGLYLFGAQLETGSFATSYIPTTGSQATRLSDSAQITGTDFSSWYRQDEGSFAVKFTERTGLNVAGQSYRHVLQSINPVNANQNSIFVGNDGAFNAITFKDGGYTSVLGGYANSGNPSLMTYGYKTDNFAASKDGSTCSTDSLGAVPTDITELHIGSTSTKLSLDALNGHISKLAYYPKRLSNLELQALSTQ